MFQTFIAVDHKLYAQLGFELEFLFLFIFSFYSVFDQTRPLFCGLTVNASCCEVKTKIEILRFLIKVLVLVSFFFYLSLRKTHI